VPPLALEFLNNPAARIADYSSVKAVINAAAPLKQETADRLCAFMGCVVTQWYGMTEASPSVASQREDEVHIQGTIGRMLPGMELKIIDGSGQG
jgi:4-coumarate--CoA ligase